MLWRLLLEYPELLAWQKFWFRSQEEVYGLLYHAVKAINPKAQVGWHIMHLVTMSPFYQADQDFGRIAKIADFLKPCAYNNCAGPRFARYIRNVHSTVFRDLTPEEVLEFHYRLLGYEHEPSLAAFRAGAPGVVLSRKYAEMKLTNLAGAGEALRELT